MCVRVPGTASAPTARAAACAPIFPPTPHPLPPTPMPACLPAHPGVAGDRDPRLPAPPTRAAPLRCVRGCRWDLPSPGARPQRWVGVGGWVHVGGWVGGWVGRWVGGQAGGWVGGWLWVGGWVHVGGCMWVGRAGGRAALTHAVTLPRGPPLSPPPMPSLPPPPPHVRAGDLYLELSRRGGHMSEAHVAKSVMLPFLSALQFMHAQVSSSTRAGVPMQGLGCEARTRCQCSPDAPGPRCARAHAPHPHTTHAPPTHPHTTHAPPTHHPHAHTPHARAGSAAPRHQARERDAGRRGGGQGGRVCLQPTFCMWSMNAPWQTDSLML